MYLLRMSSNLCVSSNDNPNSIQVASPPLKPIQLKQVKDREQEEENKEEEDDDDEESSSSCSFNEEIFVVSSNIKGEAEQVKEEEEDEGYHTPTSPRHRIPAAVDCPAAPRKPATRRRHVKRKTCCRIDITGVKLMVFSVAEMDEARRSKKAK